MKDTMLLSFAFALLFPFGMMLGERHINNRTKIAIFATYILAILYLTVFREPSNAGRQINLRLFWSYSLFRHADVRWQVYMNIILFVPFGFLIPWATRRYFFQTFLIGLLFSAGIEITQYVFKLGLCEFDDVFHNTLGTVLGYGYWRMLTLNMDKINRAMQRIKEWLFTKKSGGTRTPVQKELLKALSASLCQCSYSSYDKDVLEEATHQAVLSLICSNAEAFPIIARNVQLMWEQQELGKVLQSIPYLVLKGACAALYYPEPMRRTLGDIDLLVPPEHFSAAYRAMEKAGYTTDDPLEDDDRHVHFKRNHVLVELHRRYAILQTKEQEQLLDQWLYKAEPVEGCIGKYTFLMPENRLNGLVLLAHINQHLEDGLGLRHLVDWCVYVQHSLPDDRWPAFQVKTDQLGLTKIAKVVARFGQVYLELYPDVTWCMDVKQQTVEALLDYIFECGNFGHKDATNNTMVMVLSHGRGLKGFFKNLQQRGVANWKALQKVPMLKPFAWVYQLFRYMRRGLRGGGIGHIRQNMAASRQRNKLMDELGATRLALK